MNVVIRDLAFTVAGGAGEVTTLVGGPLHGLMTMVGVKAPNAAAPYDIQIYDAAGYLLYAENDLIGDVTISLEKICNSHITLKLLNASVPGSYSARLYARG